MPSSEVQYSKSQLGVFLWGHCDSAFPRYSLVANPVYEPVLGAMRALLLSCYSVCVSTRSPGSESRHLTESSWSRRGRRLPFRTHDDRKDETSELRRKPNADAVENELNRAERWLPRAQQMSNAPMETQVQNAACRAVAILKAKEGSEQALLDFTLKVAPEIRNVDGLRRLEVSRSLAEPRQLVLYYWWESGAHSQRYVASPLYSRIAPQLEALVQEHVLLVADLLSG